MTDIDAEVISIGPQDGSGPLIDVLTVPENRTVKNRLLLDLRADGTNTSEELRRLLDLGAQRVDVGQSADVSWAVLADPRATNSVCWAVRSRNADEESSGR